MQQRFFAALTTLTLVAFAQISASAAEHRIVKLEESAPADSVSKEVAAQLSETGISIYRGETRKVCDIWLFKSVTVPALKGKGDVIYPFSQGQMLGVIRYSRSGSDFRDQDIEAGVYTLRYAHQPVDGAHVGTSPTRDFLMLLNAEHDKVLKPASRDEMNEQSAEVAQSSHPAILSLQKVSGDSKAPSIRENTEHEWWIVRLNTNAKVGDEVKPLPLDLVVVGYASE